MNNTDDLPVLKDHGAHPDGLEEHAEALDRNRVGRESR